VLAKVRDLSREFFGMPRVVGVEKGYKLASRVCKGSVSDSRRYTAMAIGWYKLDSMV